MSVNLHNSSCSLFNIYCKLCDLQFPLFLSKFNKGGVFPGFLYKRCKLYTKDISYYFCVYKKDYFIIFLITSNIRPHEGYTFAKPSVHSSSSKVSVTCNHGSKDNEKQLIRVNVQSMKQTRQHPYSPHLKTRLARRHVERNGRCQPLLKWLHPVCGTWVAAILRLVGQLFGGSLTLQKKPQNTLILKVHVFLF